MRINAPFMYGTRMLYIVATPIGNLKDITLRALEVLRSVDLIACEDTRHTKILLKEYGIEKPTTSYFQHNKLSKGEYLIGLLKEGKSIALVSDAGTPGILDPGYNLVNMAIAHNIEATVIPGPAAFVNALVLSESLRTNLFSQGFFLQRTLARKNKLKSLLQEGRTVVLYESCHRITATLEDIKEVCGSRLICVARELTEKVRRSP